MNYYNMLIFLIALVLDINILCPSSHKKNPRWLSILLEIKKYCIPHAKWSFAYFFFALSDFNNKVYNLIFFPFPIWQHMRLKVTLLKYELKHSSLIFIPISLHFFITAPPCLEGVKEGVYFLFHFILFHTHLYDHNACQTRGGFF